jgi:hypothetical protein
MDSSTTLYFLARSERDESCHAGGQGQYIGKPDDAEKNRRTRERPTIEPRIRESASGDLFPGEAKRASELH